MRPRRECLKRGGRIVYITCSVLKAENEDRIAAFMRRHDELGARHGEPIGL